MMSTESVVTPQAPPTTNPSASSAHEGVLARAARSVTVGGAFGSMVDVLHGKVVRHYAESIRQYLSIRVGDPREGETALRKLRAIVAARPTESLVAAPGPRARLFELARSITSRYSLPSATAYRALPFLAAPQEHAVAVEAIRALPRDEDMELIELRYARELDETEIAFVIKESPEHVAARLTIATARVQEALRARGSNEGALEQAVLFAFALKRGEAIDATEEETHQPLPTSTVIGGRYAVDARVGMGSFGDVYRARDTQVSGHVVALKLLHHASRGEVARAKALRELRLIASVFHPSIVQFKDHGWFEGRLWFVMPWYDGETLESRIQRGPMSRLEAQGIFVPLARALAAMHEAGIRHQDIKPDNIFLVELPGGDVLPVLIDLGVAAKEAEMVIAGTPDYFAPEVAAQFASIGSSEPPGKAADMFSLTLSLRNALAPQMDDELAAGAIEAFIETRAKTTPGAPTTKELQYLEPHFDRWLSMNPDERPTAIEWIEELPILTEPERQRERRSRFLRRFVPFIITVAALFTATVLILNQRAERQRMEAESARLSAANLRDDLRDSVAAREEVEELAARNRERERLTRGELQEQLREVEERAIGLRRRVTTLRQMRQNLTSRVGIAEEEREAIQSQLVAATRNVSSLEADLERVRGIAQAQTADVERMTTEVTSARQQTTALQARVESLEEEVARSEATVTTVRSRLVAARARVEELEAAVAVARRQGRGTSMSGTVTSDAPSTMSSASDVPSATSTTAMAAPPAPTPMVAPAAPVGD